MIGGGYIAFEFAHIAARAGAKVVILHQGKRPLEEFDADVVALLVKAMRAIGIFIVLEAKVTAIKGESGALTVQYERDGSNHQVSARLVVHAAGRVADVAELDLAKGNVELTKKGIAVDEYLQSVSNPAVYACGDVADKGLPLTPLASYEGKIVASNILNGNNRTYVNDAVPSTVFTVPPLASIGLTEEQATKQGRKIKVLFQETTDWYVSQRINEPFSGFKTLVDEETDQVIGAHLLGSGNEEVINLFALAMKHQISATALGQMLFAYPTHASDMKSMLPD
jgi:glutathione reductase (NADPH)